MSLWRKPVNGKLIKLKKTKKDKERIKEQKNIKHKKGSLWKKQTRDDFLKSMGYDNLTNYVSDILAGMEDEHNMKSENGMVLHHTKYLELNGYDEIELITLSNHSKIHRNTNKKIPKVVSFNANVRLRTALRGLSYSDIHGGFCLLAYYDYYTKNGRHYKVINGKPYYVRD